MRRSICTNLVVPTGIKTQKKNTRKTNGKNHSRKNLNSENEATFFFILKNRKKNTIPSDCSQAKSFILGFIFGFSFEIQCCVHHPCVPSFWIPLPRSYSKKNFKIVQFAEFMIRDYCQSVFLTFAVTICSPHKILLYHQNFTTIFSVRFEPFTPAIIRGRIFPFVKKL